ncbi:MAG: cytochrome c oxidase subunit II [Anaerolineae bacterium]|nr:cytochrome c oxidase subunit II [Anaerolineae bacterium]
MRNVRHFVTVTALVLLVTYLTYIGLTSLGLMPVAASAQAGPIDWLFDLHVIMMSFLFSLITVIMVYSLVVFRRKPGETGDGAHIEGNTKLEIFWTIVPLVVVIWFGIIGADNLRQVRAVDPNALEVRVIGFQWSWRFEYPEGFSSNTLYLPANKQVLLKMESIDVLHSFWVPEFRIKQDLVPGRVTELRITPTLEGEYQVLCAEICGTSHAYMVSPVVVVSQVAYETWVTGQLAAYEAELLASAGQPDATRGEKLYTELGCKACHSLDGAAGVGPSWKGLFGQENHPLADGSVVALVDEEYLQESIIAPNNKIALGFNANAMPSFSYLRDAQVADLVEFIKTLK